MDIFVCIKVALPSEFKCDSNELIFSPIGHELGELCKFYKVFPEMEVFRAAPWVLQTAVINPIQSKCHPVFYMDHSLLFLRYVSLGQYFVCRYTITVDIKYIEYGVYM